MGKKKKPGDKKRSQERKLKRQVYERIVNQGNLDDFSNPLINQMVPIEGKIKEEDSLVCSITFTNYNHSKCEVSNLNSNTAKKLLKKFKEITKTKFKDIPNTNLIRDKVENSKKYEELYSGLTPDIELVEIAFDRDKRIFGFLIEPYLSVVAISTRHK